MNWISHENHNSEWITETFAAFQLTPEAENFRALTRKFPLELAPVALQWTAP